MTIFRAPLHMKTDDPHPIHKIAGIVCVPDSQHSSVGRKGNEITMWNRQGPTVRQINGKRFERIRLDQLAQGYGFHLEKNYQANANTQAGFYSRRSRSSRQAFAMSGAFRMAETTQMRFAPAAKTSSRVSKLIPPMANHGM